MKPQIRRSAKFCTRQGGTGFFGLREAIQEAVDAGMIVMAAAGNQVGVVTAPASYDNCIARDRHRRLAVARVVPRRCR